MRQPLMFIRAFCLKIILLVLRTMVGEGTIDVFDLT